MTDTITGADQVLTRAYQDSDKSVRVSGSNFSGSFTPSGLKTAGKTTMLTISNDQWYEVPASPLTGRNNVELQNPSTSALDVIWNYDNTKPLTEGIRTPPGGSRSIAITNGIPVYVTLSGVGPVVVAVEELS